MSRLTTKEERDSLKAVRQWMTSNGIIFSNKDTLSDLNKIMDSEKQAGTLEATYWDEIAAQEPDDSGNNQEEPESEETDEQVEEEPEEEQEEQHEAWELSEQLETIVLTIPTSEMPIKPKHQAFLQEDDELDFEAFSAAMNAYKAELFNNSDKERKRIIGNHNGLVLPIITAVLNRIGKQGVYVGENGFIKWYDEPLKQELPEGKTSKTDNDNAAAKILLHVKDQKDWTNKGQIPDHIAQDVLKTPEFKGYTLETLRANAKDKRQDIILALLKFNKEKYSIPNT
jgi:hypothetical protein